MLGSTRTPAGQECNCCCSEQWLVQPALTSALAAKASPARLAAQLDAALLLTGMWPA